MQTIIKMNLVSCFLVKLNFRLLCYEGLINCSLNNYIDFFIFSKRVKICNRIEIHGMYQLPVRRCSESIVG